MTVLERFLNYTKIDTTSDSSKDDTPSTKGQMLLAEKLLDELFEIGSFDIYFDKEHGYLYAKLNGKEDLPSIGFVSHLDTSESESGKNIKPKIIENYDGKDIELNEFTILSKEKYPDLNKHIGKTLITTDGTTLLGADDKAGIAEIMQMLEYISKSDVEHGDIYICFTPDEEIGLGTEHFDKRFFKPDFAYTVDGESLGEFSYENFNAAAAIITIKGIPAHTGDAKDKMINAIKVAIEINDNLPNSESPEETEGKEGFYHLKSLDGTVSKARMVYLLRDFDLKNLLQKIYNIKSIVADMQIKYRIPINIEIEEEYRNMYEIINEDSDLIEYTKDIITKTGIQPIIEPIRGGTDGASISYMKIPCPNLGTGGHNYHSIYEYITKEDMEKVVDILISLVENVKNKQKRK